MSKKLLSCFLSACFINLCLISFSYGQDETLESLVNNKKVLENAAVKSILKSSTSIETGILPLNHNFKYFNSDAKINVTLRDLDVASALRILAKEGKKNIVIDESVQGTITAELKGTSLNEAMQIILVSQELEARAEGETIFVASRPAMARKGLNRKVIKAFKLNNSNAIDVAKILEASIFNKGYKVNEVAGTQNTAMQATTSNSTNSSGSSDSEGSAAQASSTGQSQLISSKTIRGRVEELKAGENFSDAKKLASEIKLQAVTSTIKNIEVDNNDGGAIVIPDTRTNSILVAGLQDDIVLASEAIKYLDKPLPQVSIEVSLIELNKEDYDDLGFSIYGHSNDTTNGFNMPVNDAVNYANYSEFSYDTINSVKDSLNFRIKALLQKKKAKLIANPKIIALDGSESLIKLTDRIISKMDITISETNVNFDPTLEDIGIVLNILPKVSDSGYITMRVRPSITTSLGKEDIGDDGAFATLIQTREVLLQDARVKSGETLAIAGLTKESEEETRAKVPVLGDIPYLGAIFKTKTNTKKKTELIILITPKLISESITTM